MQSLPAPRNDYEIVVPERESDDGLVSAPAAPLVEDQADVEARAAREQEEKRE